MQSRLNEEQILVELLDRADDWAWETCIAYAGKPHTPLVLSNEWQNCGYKQSYIGKFGFYPDGKPFVYVTYHNYKYGGIKLNFPYKEVYAEIVNNHKAGKTYTPKTRKTTQENQLDQLNQLNQPNLSNQPNQVNQPNQSNQFTLSNESNPSNQPTRKTMLKQALAEDQAIWDDGVEHLPYLHSYLNRKGFTENIVDPSIRYSLISANKDCAYPQIVIIVKVIGIDGELKGFQKIYEKGNKYLTPGMPKKDNFIVLGTNGLLPERLREVFTAEGLATGATIRLATENQIPVIVTLDAANIEPVVSSLRGKYGTKSKCAITICADDDCWKALEIDENTGKPKPNTGLTKAHPVALRHRCKIVSPNFAGLNTAKLPTDFNDLMQLSNIDEVKKQLAQARKPNLHLAITQESLLQERKRVLQQFYGHKVIAINEKYLSTDLPDLEDGNIRTLEELILAHKVSLLRCPINTGKTTAISKIVKALRNKSVLYITYLTGLNKQGATQFELEDYTDYQGSNSPEYAKLTELQRLSICLNSLFKLLDKNGKLVRKIDVVIIDEIQQVIRRLTSNIQNKSRVLSALKQLVQSAKHLVLMDAHLDSVTLETLKEWLPEEKFFALLNEYQVGKGRSIVLYEHEGMIIDKAIEALNNGQRVFIVTNSRKGAWEIFYLLETVTGKIGLPITGDNPGDKRVEKLFANVNREVLNYDFIVASPSITSGISIDEDVFGFVGGVFNHTTNTPMDCLQALGRVRKANTFHVYVSDIKQTLPTTEQEIAAKWTHTHKHDQNILPFEDINNDELVDVVQDYKKICILATKEANFAKQDFLTRFIKLCILDGYNIAYSDTTPEIEAQAKFLQAEAKDLEDLEFVKGCAESKTITDEEHQKLKDKPRKTLEETLQLEKKEIIDFYVVASEAPQEIIEQTIIDDRRGKTRKEINNLEIALASDSQIQQMRKDEAKAGILLEPDKRAFATEREAYKQIVNFAGINTELIINESRYSAEVLLTTFVPWILSHYWIMKGIFPRLAKPEAIERDPIRTFGTLLKRLGLSHKRIGTTSNGEYAVDIGRLKKMREILIRRGKLHNPRTDVANKNIYPISV